MLTTPTLRFQLNFVLWKVADDVQLNTIQLDTIAPCPNEPLLKVANPCRTSLRVVKCMRGGSMFRPPCGGLHYPKTRHIGLRGTSLCVKSCKPMWNLALRCKAYAWTLGSTENEKPD